MDRPNDPAGWAKLYAQQAKRREAARSRAERAASKKQKPADHRPHPVLLHPSNVHYERAAAEAAQRALRAEHHRRHSAHPMTAFDQIPIPEAPTIHPHRCSSGT